MLEDYTMDKKASNRSAQNPSKGCATEVKKNQESINNVNGKQFPRQSKRRESPAQGAKKQGKGASSYYDNNSRQSKPRKHSFGNGGKANTQVVDQLSEELEQIATTPNNGGKKQNMNHLLNFHYAPRRTGIRGERASNRWHNTYTSAASTHKNIYNKEQYLQANCQFVVRADRDYTDYISQPDNLVDWKLIEQVRVISLEEVACPICLSTPIVGKITKCGHVYCWPCMLHYIALSDNSWRKCPICFDAVHHSDLKSVEILLRSAHSVGDKITFRLMKRKKDSMIASPVSEYEVRSNYNLLPINETRFDLIYSKLLTADVDQISTIIEKEEAELKSQIVDNQGCPELCFIEQAIQLLEERKTTLKNRSHNEDNPHKMDMLNAEIESRAVTSKEVCVDSTTGAASHCKSLWEFNSADQCSALSISDVEEKNITDEPQMASSPVADQFFPFDEQSNYDDYDGFNETGSKFRKSSSTSAFEEDEEYGREQKIVPSLIMDQEECDNCGDVETVTATSSEVSCSSGTASKYYYFYQAEDGQQLFLHVLNCQMLEMSYGSLEKSPPFITGTILEKKYGTVTVDLRNRMRYLQHMPLTCQFEVAEIEMSPPVITSDTFDIFKEKVKQRQKSRQKRAHDERRREKQMAETIQRQYTGHGPTPHLRLESLLHFPQCGNELSTSPQLLSSSVEVRDFSFSVAEENIGEDSLITPTVTSSPQSSNSSRSFAQMLKDGKSNGGGWNLTPPKRVTMPPVREPAANANSDDDNPLPAPHYRQSFSDAISTAFERASVLHQNKDDAENGGSSNNGGKKKKKKSKVLLFSTGMTCNSSK